MKLVEFKGDSATGHSVYINPARVTGVEAYVEDGKPSHKITRVWSDGEVIYVRHPVVDVVAKLRAA